MERAKQLIEEFCLDEYGNSADFSNLTRISLAYTTFEDKENGSEHEIQAYTDLVNNRMFYEIDGVIIRELKYDSIDKLIENQLEFLDFGLLTWIPDEYYDNKRTRSCDLCGKEMKEWDEVYKTTGGYVYCSAKCLADACCEYEKVRLTDAIIGDLDFGGWDE